MWIVVASPTEDNPKTEGNQSSLRKISPISTDTNRASISGIIIKQLPEISSAETPEKRKRSSFRKKASVAFDLDPLDEDADKSRLYSYKVSNVIFLPHTRHCLTS